MHSFVLMCNWKMPFILKCDERLSLVVVFTVNNLCGQNHNFSTLFVNQMDEMMRYAHFDIKVFITWTLNVHSRKMNLIFYCKIVH